MWQLLYWYPRLPAAEDVINVGFIAIAFDDVIWGSYALICCKVGFTSSDLSKLLMSTLLLMYDPCCTNRCISESSPVVDGVWRYCIGVWSSRLSFVRYWGLSSCDERANLLMPPLSVGNGSSLRALNSSKERKFFSLLLDQHMLRLPMLPISNRLSRYHHGRMVQWV